MAQLSGDGGAIETKKTGLGGRVRTNGLVRVSSTDQIDW